MTTPRRRRHTVPAFIETDDGRFMDRHQVLADPRSRAEHVSRATFALETWLEDHSDLEELASVSQAIRRALDLFES